MLLIVAVAMGYNTMRQCSHLRGVLGDYTTSDAAAVNAPRVIGVIGHHHAAKIMLFGSAKKMGKL